MGKLIKDSLIQGEHIQCELIAPHVIAEQYDLAGPDDEIILLQVWETVVQFGWTITMQVWPIAKNKPPPPTAHQITES
jgi:hypothetical protein